MYTLPLNGQQLSALDGASARHIHCVQGTLWLSFAGEDIVLRAGEGWAQRAQRGERLLLQAGSGCAIAQITPHTPRRWPAGALAAPALPRGR
jgi:hypothetical protein